MYLIATVDDGMGTAFNNRRQSRDHAVTEKICRLAAEKGIWITEYSLALFENSGIEVNICRPDSINCPDGAYCFIEKGPFDSYAARAERIILFKWNRRYPSDMKFDVDISGWKLAETEEFQGISHEKITMEVYER